MEAEGNTPMGQGGLDPATALSEAAKLGTKMLTGGRLLKDMSDGDVQIATTPKDLVWRQDKVKLFHYPPSGG